MEYNKLNSKNLAGWLKNEIVLAKFPIHPNQIPFNSFHLVEKFYRSTIQLFCLFGRRFEELVEVESRMFFFPKFCCFGLLKTKNYKIRKLFPFNSMQKCEFVPGVQKFEANKTKFSLNPGHRLRGNLLEPCLDFNILKNVDNVC